MKLILICLLLVGCEDRIYLTEIRDALLCCDKHGGIIYIDTNGVNSFMCVDMKRFTWEYDIKKCLEEK
jgi:hypothetical protein